MTWRGWQVLVLVVVTSILVGGTALIASTRSTRVGEEATRISRETARESEHRWCGVVVALDDAYRLSPPQTPVGRRIAENIAELRRQFGCA